MREIELDNQGRNVRVSGRIWMQNTHPLIIGISHVFKSWVGAYGGNRKSFQQLESEYWRSCRGYSCPSAYKS